MKTNKKTRREFITSTAALEAFPFIAPSFGSCANPLINTDQINNTLNETLNGEKSIVGKYGSWTAEHEHIMAQSLFSAGTTWPGVTLYEDQKALDVLCNREDVDAEKIGCCGLSGGGLRANYLGGLDERIKCAISVGFMTTWSDFVKSKSYTHTWMTFAPLLPNYLEFPEILALRAPLPTMVLYDNEDGLYNLPEMKKANKILE